MSVFQPKSKPILSWSRVVHGLLAATITAYGGHLWGYDGLAWLYFGSISLGFGWEVSNRWLPGPHPYGDIMDFIAFVSGATVSAAGYLLIT